MVSKRILKTLPDIEPLRRLSQSLAMLDAILSPDWEFRYYSFNSKWGQNEMMASMRDGSGDEYFILFNSSGAIVKGFAHESSMSPYANATGKVCAGVLDDVPVEFQDFLNEPAFSIPDTTFCIWRKYGDVSWQTGKITYPKGKDPDGSEDLLQILNSDPSAYQSFAEYNYEQEINSSTIQHIYSHQALTDEIVRNLNTELSLKDLQKDIEEIGYPQ
jgi:hypothetical protein